MRLGLVVVARVEAQPIGRPDSAMMDIGDVQATARPTMRGTADLSMRNTSLLNVVPLRSASSSSV